MLVCAKMIYPCERKVLSIAKAHMCLGNVWGVAAELLQLLSPWCPFYSLVTSQGFIKAG